MFLSVRAASLCILALASIAKAQSAENSVDLAPLTQPGELTQVSIQLEAGGNTVVRAQTDDAATIGPEQRLPMSVSAKLQYVERRLGTADSSVDPGTPLAARYYNRAQAVIKVDEGGVAPQLPDERKLILVEGGSLRPGLYCPNGPLTREQLDLIDTIGNSCIVDQLLPKKRVADGDSWSSDATVLAALLTFDTVAACEVQSVLEEFNAGYAKVRLAGTVHGTVDGAATEQDIRGVYLFDRRLRRITRLNLAVHEQRSIGDATPGLDAVARLQVTIDPIASAPELTDEALGKIGELNRTPARDLVFEAATMGFRVHHDRQWFITSRQRETITMRRIDGSDLIAQCTLAILPPKSAGRQTSLEQFQKDVTYALGKSFGQLVSTRQWQNAHGNYCYEVIVRGTVEQVPVEWHYYLVARESGHRVTAAITIAEPAVARVASADRVLIEQMELFPPMPTAQTAAAVLQQSTK